MSAPGTWDRTEGAARSALIALAHCAEPADARLGALLGALGPVETLHRVHAGATGLPHGPALQARLTAATAREADQSAEGVGARIVTRVDREWPTQLDDLGPRVPLALWVAGAADLRLLALRSIAMVGARACTPYGQEVARQWSAELTSEGCCVLSGGAFGIDGAAHRGALSAGGPTLCILAGGVDVPYPRAHDALLARIADEGLVLSESPPGEAVRRQRFLSRNRVIAAMSRATLVIEAAERSGTIATARAALAMNRPLFAVPGPVTSPASAGCHRMLRDGEAILATSAAEVMDVLDLGRRSTPAPDRLNRPTDSLSEAERKVLDALPARGSCTVDAVARAAGLPATTTWAALGTLECSGWVRASGDGWRLARLSDGRPVP